MFRKAIDITVPLSDDVIMALRAGDEVYISGVIYTARDAAHKRLIEMLKDGKQLPLPLEGQVIYYVGPCPEKPGEIIGSAGPTTSGRMDAYTQSLLDRGLKGMIGKGQRSKEVKESIKKNKAVYFGAIGGAAALISASIQKQEVIAFEDLGTEAIRKLIVRSFPAIVIIDSSGRDLYEEGQRMWRKGI